MTLPGEQGIAETIHVIELLLAGIPWLSIAMLSPVQVYGLQLWRGLAPFLAAVGLIGVLRGLTWGDVVGAPST